MSVIPVYHFEFKGGCLDGRTISMNSDDPNERQEARFYYLATRKGTIGKRTMGVSPHYMEMKQQGIPPEQIEPQAHFYEVCENVEDGDHVLVRMEYLGTDDPCKKPETEQGK